MFSQTYHPSRSVVSREARDVSFLVSTVTPSPGASESRAVPPEITYPGSTNRRLAES